MNLLEFKFINWTIRYDLLLGEKFFFFSENLFIYLTQRRINYINYAGMQNNKIGISLLFGATFLFRRM